MSLVAAVVLLPIIVLAHYCPQLDDQSLIALESVVENIEIERIDLVDSVFYKFRVPDVANKQKVIAVGLRFGFGAHPGGAVTLDFKTDEPNYISFSIDSITAGFRGCVEILYGAKCGIMPQIVMTFDEAYINENARNTVYCGFVP